MYFAEVLNTLMKVLVSRNNFPIPLERAEEKTNTTTKLLPFRANEKQGSLEKVGTSGSIVKS